ncbi:hypothetical protein ACWD25_02490 [Streptomyces sp. NPDC002920]
MTRWHRGLYTTAIGATLLLPWLPPAHEATGREPTQEAALARATGSPRPSSSSREPDRAGSRAGEGRVRPGREDAEDAEDADDADDADTGAEEGVPEDDDEADEADEADGGGEESGETTPEGAVPPRTPVPSRDAVPRAAPGEADGPVLRILPLGSGLVLIGLGLALGLAALRLRRS